MQRPAIPSHLKTRTGPGSVAGIGKRSMVPVVREVAHVVVDVLAHVGDGARRPGRARAPAAARPPVSEAAGVHADRHRRHERVERGVRPEHSSPSPRRKPKTTRSSSSRPWTRRAGSGRRRGYPSACRCVIMRASVWDPSSGQRSRALARLQRVRSPTRSCSPSPRGRD